MYSLFDSVFDVPFGYSIPRDRVVVIPDSQYNKLRAQENERQVAKLEARKEHHSQVIERLNEQIGELEASLPAAEPTEGYKSLFIGHSFFVPMARGMTTHAHRAGFKDHEQLVFFEGGDRGTPGYFWENSRHSGDIKKALQSGKIELFGMTWTGVGRGKGTFEHFKLWVDYAIQHNPKTTFCLAMPWGRFPARYKVDTFTQEMKKATSDFHKIIDRLREAYPENEFFCINYGQGAVELKKLYH